MCARRSESGVRVHGVDATTGSEMTDRPRRVTFSRNVTLSLSRTCISHCKYCAFKTQQPHLQTPAEVEQLLDWSLRKSVKELLILTGDNPGHHPGIRSRLAELGFDNFVDYVVWCCERALERGILPHTNLGLLSRDELARLREVTASQGLMLESTRADLVAHQGSPTKDPAERLRTIRWAGELRIPFTSGILVGIGETTNDRLTALERLAEMHAEHGHLQEVILQNFVPHRTFYGQEPGELATEAADRFWRTGLRVSDGVPLPSWASPVSLPDMISLIDAAKRMLPGVGIQVPPNLAEFWPELIDAGATDLGGLSANGDHISPEEPFPSPAQIRRTMSTRGVAVSERLCAHGRYLNSEWLGEDVLDVVRARYWSFIPRHGSGRTTPPFAIRRELVGPAIEDAHAGRSLTVEAMTAMFAETRADVIEAMRVAADELRRDLAGDVVTFVVNRNINVSNICIVGCSFCGFGQSKRAPDAYEHSEEEFRRRVAEAVEYGATELCLQSGIHPDWTLDHYLQWLVIARDESRQAGVDLHLHAYSPMEIAHMCDISELTPSEVLTRLRDAGLGSTPGTAAEVLHDGVRARISPNKLPVARWVEIIQASHRVGLRSTSTVMFGHIEEPWELAEHMLIVRKLQERTGGITEFVPLSFIPFMTLLGRRHGIEEISPEENLKHTAVFRLALGPSVRNVQASWVKMGLPLATEALRWGVNDLGGTLMEESISRLAGSRHGVRLDPPQLIGAAHAANRPAAQRSTLYETLRHFPLPDHARSRPDDVANANGNSGDHGSRQVTSARR
jgi:FO synthase